MTPNPWTYVMCEAPAPRQTRRNGPGFEVGVILGFEWALVLVGLVIIIPTYGIGAWSPGFHYREVERCPDLGFYTVREQGPQQFVDRSAQPTENGGVVLRLRCPDTGGRYVWYPEPTTVYGVPDVVLACTGYHTTIRWRYFWNAPKAELWLLVWTAKEAGWQHVVVRKTGIRWRRRSALWWESVPVGGVPTRP